MADQSETSARNEAEAMEQVAKELRAEDELSPVLAALPPEKLREVKTRCANCRHAVWWITGTELRCYCRVMYVVTWSGKDPLHIEDCDGTRIGQ